MSEKVKISAVSYLNTKPFLYGLEQSTVSQEFTLSLDVPSECARKLLSGEVDMGLVPVAVIPQMKQAHIIGDYCIGANGAVHTVCIYSRVPLEEIEELYLDYQSRTSVALVQVLLNEYWGLTPTLLSAKQGYEKKIHGKIAAVIIGDRTIGLDNQYPFVYDLAETWKAMTGLPFVFAAWVSNRKLSDSFSDLFNQALSVGIENRKLVAEQLQPRYPNFSVFDYYYKYIDYKFTNAKKEALSLFLQKIRTKQESSTTA